MFLVEVETLPLILESTIKNGCTQLLRKDRGLNEWIRTILQVASLKQVSKIKTVLTNTTTVTRTKTS